MEEPKSNAGTGAKSGPGSRFDFDTEKPENPAATAARAIPLYLAELKAYAIHFLSAKVDGFKATGKKIVGLAILGVVGAIIGVGVLLSAAFLLMAGLAGALGALFGGRVWLGDLIVGVVVLGAVVAGTLIFLKKFTESSRKQTEQKYEGKRIQQRVDFGRDVHQRAQPKG